MKTAIVLGCILAASPVAAFADPPAPAARFDLSCQGTRATTNRYRLALRARELVTIHIQVDRPARVICIEDCKFVLSISDDRLWQLSSRYSAAAPYDISKFPVDNHDYTYGIHFDEITVDLWNLEFRRDVDYSSCAPCTAEVPGFHDRILAACHYAPFTPMRVRIGPHLMWTPDGRVSD